MSHPPGLSSGSPSSYLTRWGSGSGPGSGSGSRLGSGPGPGLRLVPFLHPKVDALCVEGNHLQVGNNKP